MKKYCKHKNTNVDDFELRGSVQQKTCQPESAISVVAGVSAPICFSFFWFIYLDHIFGSGCREISLTLLVTGGFATRLIASLCP